MLKAPFTLLDDFAPTTYEAWRARVEQDLKGAPFEKKLVNHTYDGITRPPVYTAEDWANADDPTGLAGAAPFTRGGLAAGHSAQGWDVRVAHDLDTESAAIQHDLQRGATSVELRVGGRETLYTLGASLSALPVTTPISLNAGAHTLPAALALSQLWEQREDADEQEYDIHGAFNADPIGVLAANGRLPTSLHTALKHAATLAMDTAAIWEGKVRAIQVSTAVYHAAGCTASQDLGWAMATGLEYLRAMERTGMDVTAAARQITFSFSVGCEFFLAIAKLRAARALWSRVVEAAGGEPTPMIMHVAPSARVLTQRDPWVNILRNTVCCFAGAVAGADSITAATFDQALGQPDDFARRVARNTQTILREESHLARVVDPAGGSWMLEKLTDDLMEKGWTELQAVEASGGMARAVSVGRIAAAIAEARAPRERDVARRKAPITGVSEFPHLDEAPVVREPVKVDDTDKLRAGNVGSTDLIHDVATALMREQGFAAIMAALPSDGPPAQCTPIAPRPNAAPFEALRDASDAHLARTGARPKVFLANLGPVAHHTARAGYAQNFFEAGGFKVLSNDGFADASTASNAFKASGATIAVLCSSDKLYPTLVPTVVPALKAAGARAVVLAGHPRAREADDRAAGVDRFIHVGCDVLDTLTALLTEEGVLR